MRRIHKSYAKMDLRKSEQELSSLANEYKCLCLRPLQRKLLNSDGILDGIPALLNWEDLLKSRQKQKAANEAQEQVEQVQVEQVQEQLPEESIKDETEISAQELIHTLVKIRDNLINLKSKVEKFRKRLTMKDPVTNAPRYGNKTIERVTNLLETNDMLQTSIDHAFALDGESEKNGSISIVQALQQSIQADKDSNEKIIGEEEAAKLKLETQRKERELEIELEVKRSEERERLKQQREKEELSRKAEEARRQRIQKEQQEMEEEREAVRAFMASIEVNVNGVKTQLQNLNENCTKVEFDNCLKALHTIFKQITSRPEEIQFRRIRLDHPKFMEDIGRHHGGKELLASAGFKFKDIDGVKCFFSAEPDLMTDMDGWSSWFDLMKGTYEELDDQLLRRKNN